jgi:VWFA-related protein
MSFRRPAFAAARRSLKPRLLLAALLPGLCLAAVSRAQRPAPSPTQTPTAESTPAPTPRQGEDEVVRITTNLVQVDAVVLDGDGNPVTNLRPDEVQIYEDGRPRKITNFSYIADTGGRAGAAAPSPTNGAAPPPSRLRPEDVRRTIALVVDDLGLSFQTIHSTRRALKKFVDEQMRPGDMVAIIRTSGGVGALQQFTSDRRQLYAAIEAVKWYGLDRSGPTPFEPTDTPTPGTKGPEMDAKKAEQKSDLEDLSTVGTLGAIGHVVRGLRDLPGRKTVVVISDGIRVQDDADPARDTRTGRALRRLIDQAARASVVIHTMNAAGLQWYSASAADSLATHNGLGVRDVQQMGELVSGRAAAIAARQAGLSLLAEKTGGSAVYDSNDLGAGIRRVMNDAAGYYLIGYQPDEATFDAKTGRRLFHRLSLKVTRPGKFRVRMRDGFFGVPDEEATAPSGTQRDQLAGALLSPFGASGVSVRLTSLFANDAKTGSFTRSILYVDANDLTFKEEADGWRTATFDVVTVTFDEAGNPVDELSRTDALRVRDEAYRQVLKYGFVYYAVLPVKRPGAYQLRTVLRDHESGRVGSAGQFVEIPDLKKRRLALSGLVLDTSAPGQPAAVQESEGARPQPDPRAGEAVRHFKAGMLMRYGFVIYNARLDKDTRAPRLQVQARLFRDGQPVFTGKVQPFALNNPPDLSRLAAGGSITLGADMPPGEYLLQVLVSDLLADEKHRTASQWIDFEITK